MMERLAPGPRSLTLPLGSFPISSNSDSPATSS
jgi:hypothetical protein